MVSKKKMTILITVCAAMIALQIIFERYLSISIPPASPIFRVSFTFIPRAITGMCLGIVFGCICSGIADLVGSFLFYASVNPIISLAAIIRGGLFAWLYKGGKKPSLLKVIITAFLSEFLCGGVITTIGLILFNGAPNTWQYWGGRCLQVSLTFVVEIFVLQLCSKYVFPQVRSYLNRIGFFDSEGSRE